METKEGEAITTASGFGEGGGAAAGGRDLPHRERPQVGRFAAYFVLLTLIFLQPLTRLMLYAANSELHSHILLVPFIAGYLLYLQRDRPSPAYRMSLAGTGVLGGIGIAALALRLAWRESLSINDGLSVLTLAFVSFAAAGGFLFLGSKFMIQKAFPVAFLIFMVPLPDAVVDTLEK